MIEISKIKYFFKDIFENGNNPQKVILLLFVINLFTPVFLTYIDLFTEGEEIIRLGRGRGELMFTEFLLFIFISFILIFSIKLFKSKKPD